MGKDSKRYKKTPFLKLMQVQVQRFAVNTVTPLEVKTLDRLTAD